MAEILETTTNHAVVRTFLLRDGSVETHVDSLIDGEQLHMLNWTNANARDAVEGAHDESADDLTNDEIQAFMHRNVWRIFDRMEKSRWIQTAS